MGLDWQPLGKPRHGQEVEFGALYEELVRSKDVDSSIWDRFAKIEISPYETLGAPRVGTDAGAGRWRCWNIGIALGGNCSSLGENG